MATLRIDIEGNPKSIPYRSFLDVANNTLAILGDLDHRFSHRQQGAVEWYMNDLRQNGSLRLEIYSKIVQLKRKQLPDVAKQVAGSFVKGFEMLETQGRSPEYLTSYGMDRAKQMTNVIGHEGAHTIRASSPETEETIEITKKAVQNLELLLPEASKSIGSVEGMLEAISVHKKPVFVIYEGIFGKAVTCEFRGLDILSRVKDSLGLRVRVRGIISRNSKSEPRKVTLETLEDFKVFGKDFKILSFRSLGGSDREFTDGLTNDEFIQRIRG